MGYSCKSQHPLSAYDSLKYNSITVFYAVTYPGDYYPANIVLTQGGKRTGYGVYMCSPIIYKYATMGEWKVVNDTLYIYNALGVSPTDTNKLITEQLSQGSDTVTQRYKIIGDALYDITDWTEFNKQVLDELGLTTDPVNYHYKPDLVYPVYRMLRISKDKVKDI